MSDVTTDALRQETCPHRYLTSHGRGWECADCGVGILSISVPLTMPLVVEALTALASQPKDSAPRG